MKTERLTTDTKGRVKLPRSFVNSAVIVEYVSETEIHIHKAQVFPVDEIPLQDAEPLVVSDGDWDRFLEFLDNPPKSNAALRTSAAPPAQNHE